MAGLLFAASVIERVNGAIGRSVRWLVLLMILLGFTNAVLRYLGEWIGQNLSTNIALEAQWYMFSVIFLMMGSYALDKDAHVRVDVLYSMASGHTKAWINFLGSVFFLIPFCLTIVYFSQSFVIDSIKVFERSPDPGGLPRWPLKLLVPVAFVLLALQGLALAIRSLAIITGVSSPTDGDTAGHDPEV